MPAKCYRNHHYHSHHHYPQYQVHVLPPPLSTTAATTSTHCHTHVQSCHPLQSSYINNLDTLTYIAYKTSVSPLATTSCCLEYSSQLELYQCTWQSQYYICIVLFSSATQNCPVSSHFQAQQFPRCWLTFLLIQLFPSAFTGFTLSLLQGTVLMWLCSEVTFMHLSIRAWWIVDIVCSIRSCLWFTGEQLVLQWKQKRINTVWSSMLCCKLHSVHNILQFFSISSFDFIVCAS